MKRKDASSCKVVASTCTLYIDIEVKFNTSFFAVLTLPATECVLLELGLHVYMPSWLREPGPVKSSNQQYL